MTGLKKNSLLLLLALGLVSVACGDDDEPDSDGNDGAEDGTPTDGGDGQDGTPTDGDGGDGGGGDLYTGACAAGGIFEGSEYADIGPLLKSEGACLADTDVSEACEFNLSDVAANAGRDCISAPDQLFQECVRQGDGGTLKGILGANPALSSGCADCYAASVKCTKDFCLGDCLADSTTDACVQCRATNNCTSAFYTCSGFPTPAELNP